MGLTEEDLEVTKRPVSGVDVRVIRDVIPVVPQGRRAKGEKPKGRDAEVLKVVQFPDEPLEVSDAVPVAIGERADVKFVDDGVLVPEGVIIQSKVFPVAISHRGRPLHEVIEITLRADPAPQAKDVSWNNAGIKLHVVPRTVPEVSGVAQKVMHLIGLLRANPHR